MEEVVRKGITYLLPHRNYYQNGFRATNSAEVVEKEE